MQINLTEQQCVTLRDFLAASDDPAEVSLSIGNGHSGFGLYVWESEYPEEGATFIAPTSPAAPAPAQPSDAQMQQDAARYRWLRDKTAEKHPDFYADVDRWSVSKERRGTGQCFSGERLDAAIDAAMGKTTGSEGERDG